MRHALAKLVILSVVLGLLLGCVFNKPQPVGANSATNIFSNSYKTPGSVETSSKDQPPSPDEPPSMDNLADYVGHYRRFDRSSDDPYVKALETLGQSPDFMERLLAVFDESGRDAKMAILMMITDEDIIPDPSPYIPKLYEYMNDADEYVALISARVLMLLGHVDDRVIDKLAGYLTNPDEELCHTAIWTLEYCGEPANRIVPQLVAMLDDERPSIRGSLVRAIGRLGIDVDGASTKILELLKNETDPDRRFDIAEALTNLHHPDSEVFNVLIDNIDAHYPGDQINAIKDLGSFGPAAFEAVYRMAEKYSVSNLHLREYLADAIMEIDPDYVLPEVDLEAVAPKFNFDYSVIYHDQPTGETVEAQTGASHPEIDSSLEYQPVEFHWNSVMYMMEKYTQGYFMENQAMPDSLDTLSEAGWYPFLPAPTPEAPNLSVVDRRLGSWDQDRDNVRFGFSEAGYIFEYYDGREPGQTPYIYDYSIDDEVSDWLEMWSVGVPNMAGFSRERTQNVNDYEIRNNFMSEIINSMIDEFFRANQFMPRNLAEFYHNRWRPNPDSLPKLPIYNSGEPGYFRFGVIPGGTSTYVEFIGPDGVLEHHETSYSMGNGSLNLNSADQSKTDISDVLFLADSSLYGWGLLDLPETEN